MRFGKYQGVTAFAGMPGSGKTYALAQAGLYWHKRGVPVWCNAGFDFAPSVEAGTVFRSFADFFEIPGGSVILFDEAPLYFNARKWSEFPDGVWYRLTQIRKAGLRLYYSTIDLDLVDVNLRRLTFQAWDCRAITGRLLWRERYNVRKGAMTDKPNRREFVIVRSSIARQYDTLGTVASPLKVKPQDATPWLPPAPAPAAPEAPEAAPEAPWQGPGPAPWWAATPGAVEPSA